ncbi:hypothetical protein [Mycolicibacterium parafortuitum]|nr:hypothetical protein [Mycolicibacterium parafortuitum]
MTNGQLAGVLAGFLVVATTTLLMKEKLPPNSVSHTLALLATGVVVLGIDAYLFGSVAAAKPPSRVRDPELYCYSAWVQFMPAAGMLAVGATLLIGGLGWMLTQHTISEESPNKQLTQLGTMLTGMTMFATSALLMNTCFVFIRYVDAMRVEPAEISSSAALAAQLVAGIGGGLAFILAMWILTVKTFGFMFFVKTDADWAQVRDPRHKSVEALSALTGFYVAFCAGTFIILTSWPTFLTLEITALHRLWWSVSLCVLVPSLLFLLIAATMPGKYHRFGRGIRRIRIYLFLKFLAHDFHAKDKRLKIKHKKFAKLALGDIVIELASWRAYSIVKIANPNEKKVRKLVLVRIYFDRSDVFGDNIDVVHREYRKRDILVLRDSMDE